MTAESTTIENDHLVVSVSALGAETQRIKTHSGQDVLWDGNPEHWTGRSPILFPIVGRAPNGRLAFGAHEGDMPKHGFARTSVFDLAETGPDMCRYVLKDSEATREIYPFEFRFSITHRLIGTALEVTAEVENLGDDSMPFGFGFHPAFRWPLPGGEGLVHEVRLDNRGAPALARLKDGSLPKDRYPSPFNEGHLALHSDQFIEDAMIFPEGAGEGLTFGVPDGPELKFSFENLPNLGIWTKPGAPYLCIEPWHGMDAVTGASPQMQERPYVFDLAAGKAAQFRYTVDVRL